MKKIIITGGAGFIGSNLSRKLISRGYQVTVLDNLHPQIHGDNPQVSSPLYASLPKEVVFVKGSVTDRALLLDLLPKHNIIVHFAAETGTGQSMYEIERYSNVNIGGTALILDVLANNKTNIEKVVVASSRAIYGEGKYWSVENGVVYPEHRKEENLKKGVFEVDYPGCAQPLQLMPTDEESKIHPSSVYGITKQTQEQLVITVTKALGIAGVAFRYQNVYGPGQSLTNPYTGILSIFSNRILQNKSINVFEDGKESRDFLYIGDAVDATVLGIERYEANNQIFNVGSGSSTNVMTVVEGLMKNYGIEVPVNISGNYRVGDIRHNYADLSKVSDKLGFKPKISFEEGLANFARWAKNQTFTTDRYEDSLQEMKDKGLFK